MLGVSVYGLSEDDVMLFGVSASVIAAIGAVIGGLLDDRFGAKPVIIGALTAMIAVGLVLLDVVGALARSGSADCCCACSSGRRCRRRGH